MYKHIYLFLLLLLSPHVAWGQLDTLSYESIVSYYQSKTKTIEFFQVSGNTDKVMELTKERDSYIDALGDNYGKGSFFLILSGINYDLGDYQNALEACSKTESIFKKVLSKEHPEYALCLNNLAKCNSSLGNYTEAIRLGTEAMEIRKKVLGTEHPDYALSLDNLATYYADLGNYTEAIRGFLEQNIWTMPYLSATSLSPIQITEITLRRFGWVRRPWKLLKRLSVRNIPTMLWLSTTLPVITQTLVTILRRFGWVRRPWKSGRRFSGRSILTMHCHSTILLLIMLTSAITLRR